MTIYGIELTAWTLIARAPMVSPLRRHNVFEMVNAIYCPQVNESNASRMKRTAICRTLEGIQAANYGNG